MDDYMTGVSPTLSPQVTKERKVKAESLMLGIGIDEGTTSRNISHVKTEDSEVSGTWDHETRQLLPKPDGGDNGRTQCLLSVTDECRSEPTTKAKQAKPKKKTGKKSNMKLVNRTKSEKIKSTGGETLLGAKQRKTRKGIYKKATSKKKAVDIAVSEPRVNTVIDGKITRDHLDPAETVPCLENSLFCLPVHAVKANNNVVEDANRDAHGEQELVEDDTTNVKPDEGFSCGLKISRLGVPKQRSEMLKTTPLENISKSFSTPCGIKNNYKASELRLGLGYNKSLSELNTASTVLDTLAVQGSSLLPREQLQEERQASTLSNSNVSPCGKSTLSEVDDDDMNPSKRRRTIPTILARSRSRLTVRELLEKSRQLTQNAETDCEISCLAVGKTRILPTTIPPKRASLSMSLSGKQVDAPANTEKISSYSFSTSVSPGPPVVRRRYKNTRYSLPFKGPTIIVPKNYSMTAANLGFISSTQAPATFLLPKLDDNDSRVIRETYKRTGKITSLPSMSIGTIGSLSSIYPVSMSSQSAVKDVQGECHKNSSKIEHLTSKQTVPCTSGFLKPNHPPSVEKLPKLEVSGKASFKDHDSKQTMKSEDETVDVAKLKKREFTSLKDYFDTASRTVLTSDRIQRRENSTGIYRHPFIGMFSEMLAKSQLPRHDSTTSQVNDSDNVGTSIRSAGTSISAVLPSSTSSLTTKSSSNCLYCEIEKKISTANVDRDEISSASVDNEENSKASVDREEDPTSLPDHAYTKTTESSPSNFPFYINPPSSNDSEELPKLLNTSLSSNQIPVYAYRYGEQLLLFPSSFSPGDPIAPATSPDLKFNKDVPSGYRSGSKTPSAKSNKRHRNRNGIRNKSKKSRKASPSKLEFVSLVELAPVTLPRSRKSNLERVISNIQRTKYGEDANMSTTHKFVAKIIQIDRSSDSVFTQITNLVKLEFYDGSDPLLKRWQEHEDYNVRILYDNVSGAIRKIEADTLKPGFYSLVKTGTAISDEQDTKTLATLQVSIPNANTIFNNFSFIAVGKIVKDNDTKVQKQPPNIQKHRNFDYLLKSLTTLSVINDVTEHVSDRSYLPKIDSPKWYSRKHFDLFSTKRHVRTKQPV